MQGRICFKLVNAERNRELLAGSPHLLYHDLTVVFYVIAGGSFKEGISTIAVKKDIQDMWGVDARTIYAAALRNTGLLLGCSVQSMADVLREMAAEKLDGGCSADASFPFPMYVAGNSHKFNGAAVLLYPGLLEWFADKASGDFYILPSSIHEVLFLPCSAGFEPEEVRSLVHEVNRAEVLPEDFYQIIFTVTLRTKAVWRLFNPHGLIFMHFLPCCICGRLQGRRWLFDGMHFTGLSGYA